MAKFYSFDLFSVTIILQDLLCIHLQVLLSQCHRFRALVLLGRFLDMGPWAVDLVLADEFFGAKAFFFFEQVLMGWGFIIMT